MGKSKIEWCDYTINPVKGLCPMMCSYCYARRMYKRFKWDEELALAPWWSNQLYTLNKPSKIFIGSTMELFGDWIKPEWMHNIMSTVKVYPQHTFIFLTKQPQNLIKWSFPDNCWVGVSATKILQYYHAMDGLSKIEAKLKFLSFEPLLESIGTPGPKFLDGISWVIIGAQTPYSKKTTPRLEWVKDIVDAADKAGIPVFLKDNLHPLFAADNCLGFILHKDKLFKIVDNYPTRYHLRQEFPINKGGN